MSLIADQAAALAAIVSAVPNIGVVLDHQPYPMKDWDKFVTTLTADISPIGRHVRAWTIQYVAEEREPRNIASTNRKELRTTHWLVRGHLSVNESVSDVIFRDLIEAVMDAIDQHASLTNTMQDHDPCDVQLPADGAPVALGDIVVHYCEIRFTGWIEATYATS
jgi:hypothetical protein